MQAWRDLMRSSSDKPLLAHCLAARCSLRGFSVSPADQGITSRFVLSGGHAGVVLREQRKTRGRVARASAQMFAVSQPPARSCPQRPAWVAIRLGLQTCRPPSSMLQAADDPCPEISQLQITLAPTCHCLTMKRRTKTNENLVCSRSR